jgi:hypothetical protein
LIAEFAQIHHDRLAIQNSIYHELQGEPIVINLLGKNSSTGALDVELQAITRHWWKTPLRRHFLGTSGDKSIVFIEDFQVSELLLLSEIVDLVVAVKHGTRLYQVETPVAPNGLDRYWQIRINSVGKVEA